MRLDERCKAIRLLLTDVDGVMTDGGLAFTNECACQFTPVRNTLEGDRRSEDGLAFRHLRWIHDHRLRKTAMDGLDARIKHGELFAGGVVVRVFT